MKGSESADPKLETAEPKSRKRKIKIVESQKLETQTERIRDRRTGRSVDRKTEKTGARKLGKAEALKLGKGQSAQSQKRPKPTCPPPPPKRPERAEPKDCKPRNQWSRRAQDQKGRVIDTPGGVYFTIMC